MSPTLNSAFGNAVLRKYATTLRNLYMAIVSTSGEIVRVNSALKSIIGFTDAQLSSAEFESLLPGYECSSYRRELAKLFYGAVESIQIEQRLLRSNGDTVWVNWTASLIPATADEPPQYVFQFQDINDKKLAERRLAFDALHETDKGEMNARELELRDKLGI